MAAASLVLNVSGICPMHGPIVCTSLTELVREYKQVYHDSFITTAVSQQHSSNPVPRSPTPTSLALLPSSGPRSASGRQRRPRWP